MSNKFLGWLVAYGTICRLTQYLAHRSLWVDEAKYAVKIMDYSYLQLLDPRVVISDPWTVKYETAGPLGFFQLSKFLTQCLGNSEYVLRLVPLTASIAALFLMVKLAKEHCTALGAAIAVLLFAIDTVLITRSADFHPYAGDVAVTLLLFLALQRVRTEGLKMKDVLSFGLLGAVALWFSIPSVFVLAGLGTALSIDFGIYKRKNALKPMFLVMGLWLLSFVIYYFGYLKVFSSNMLWGEERFRNIFTDEPMRFDFWYLPAGFLLLGTAVLFLKNKMRFLYLCLPILFTFIAAMLGLYPFSGRLILFLVPVFYILIAQGVIAFKEILPKSAGPVFILVLLFLCGGPLLESAKRTVKPIYREEIRPVIAKAKMLHRENDPLYIYAFAGPAFHYYAKRFGFNEGTCVYGVYHHGKPEIQLPELNAIKGNRKVWIIYAHINNIEGRQFLAYLDHIGKKEYSYVQPGAGLLLYDFK